MPDKWGVIVVLTSLWAASLVGADKPPQQTESVREKANKAAQEGKIAYKLTTPEELEAILGPPRSEERDRDGGMELLTLRYPDLTVLFGRMREFAAPFTLLSISIKDSLANSIPGLRDGNQLDIGEDRPLALRSTDDLARFDAFWGFAGVSLAKLDLRRHKPVLEKMPFDSQTQWPPRDRLPDGFDPARRLEEGKHPGLGVGSLHAQGIDGHGVGIAIIDQPLLQDHQEYAGQLARYVAVDVGSMPPEMHSAPIASIAAGQTCGVAPKASLYCYAGRWDGNKTYAELLQKIVALNTTLTDHPKIRVVSISLGMFSQRPDFGLWKAAVDQAAQNGILVVTCDPTFLRMAVLRRDALGDPNDPACYTIGQYSAPRPVLGVPGGNRTTASHVGRKVYTYWVEGGQSWAVPYLAGLAALAFQVDPEIKPAQIVELWTATATKTAAGPVVNPPEFIKAVRAHTTKKAP